MLDALERDQRTDDLRALVETIVYPFATELATESGRDYLRILPQVTGRLRIPVGKIASDVRSPRHPAHGCGTRTAVCPSSTLCCARNAWPS